VGRGLLARDLDHNTFSIFSVLHDPVEGKLFCNATHSSYQHCTSLCHSTMMCISFGLSIYLMELQEPSAVCCERRQLESYMPTLQSDVIRIYLIQSLALKMIPAGKSRPKSDAELPVCESTWL